MAGEAQDPKLWPLPEFYFKVTISDVGQSLSIDSSLI